MIQDLDKALKFTLKWEGGYVNHPNDPGGETKFGISKRQYPHLDIGSLTLEDAIAIYRKDYWDAYNCEDYPFPLNICLFDSVVLFSPNTPLGWAAQTKAENDWRKFLRLRLEFHLARVAKNPKLKPFKQGWINRVNDLDKYCQILIADSFI